MREIKFRAWHLDDGMLYFDFDSFAKDYHNQYENIMQYIGLKDPLGKEIYEGDIVSGGSRVMIVKFEQQACQFWLTWKDNEGINRYEPLTATFGDDKGYMCNHGICVIGNIYENPELLK